MALPALAGDGAASDAVTLPQVAPDPAPDSAPAAASESRSTSGGGGTAAAPFTFRRVRVGDLNPDHRITVQIDPEEQARLLAALPRVNDHPQSAPDAPALPLQALAGAATYGWFWDRVSPLMSARDGRFEMAMAALSQGPQGTSVAAPRLSDMQDLANRYGKTLLGLTLDKKVSPALALAIMSVESGGNPQAQSSKGAQGLMQLIPATASRFGVDATDPDQNLKGGVAYLDWLMGTFDSDPIMVIAAYNAGEGAVAANSGVPPYPETRDYVPKVLAAWQVAAGLCITPPLLMTDPCVFKVVSATP